jgi:acyl-CoA synthetase (AMP-forming)/AMP-acid ligase II
MPCYWTAPGLTDAALAEGPDGDRWFRTGDVVRRESGILYFVDRLDGIILSGGEKVATSRVESVLTEIDEVEAAAVLGTPHDQLGEAVTVAVVADESVTGG